jgi:multisubunit Na+/H+ antiporter MnhG subunit
VVSLVDDLTSTFTTTPPAGRLLSRTIIIFVLFGAIWALGGIGMLMAVYSRVQSPTKANKVASVVHTLGESLLEKQRQNLVLMREYVHMLLPAIYDTNVALKDRVWNELLRCHKYLVLIAPAVSDVDKMHRIRMIFQVLTTQTIFLFLIAWIYDLDVSQEVTVRCGDYCMLLLHRYHLCV